MDESNTLIDNSEAGELVHNNSQWHPGFSALGSVPGTITPAVQIAVQAAAATPAEQDLEIEDEDEDEDEDEADEEMDEIDNIDDAFDEDALDEGEDSGPAAFGEALFLDTFGLMPPDVLLHTPQAANAEQSMSDETSILEDDYSDLPDLEEMPVAEQTDHQATAGNEQFQHDLGSLADTRLRRVRRRVEDSVCRTRESHRSILRHHTCQDLSEFCRSTFQSTPNGRKRYSPGSRHPFRCRPEKAPARFNPQPSALPTSVESKDATRLQLPNPNGTS